MTREFLFYCCETRTLSGCPLTVTYHGGRQLGMEADFWPPSTEIQLKKNYVLGIVLGIQL